jgi:hypothetical protein
MPSTIEVDNITSYISGNPVTINDSLRQGNGGVAQNGSHSEGNNNWAQGNYSHAEGSNSNANGNSSHAEGANTEANGNYSHSEGAATKANNQGSHAEGYNTTADGSYTHTEGSNTQANGYGSHAEGDDTTANGQHSHSEGKETIAASDWSHAEGWETAANAPYSHAEGRETTARGNYSHSEGWKTTAGGLDAANTYAAHAEGYLTEASEAASHAEGVRTTASAQGAHSEGTDTIASGITSHSEGLFTVASGTGAHAEGQHTIADGNYSHVSGKYNISDATESAFIVGNGLDDLNRSNLLLAAANQVEVFGNTKTETIQIAESTTPTPGHVLTTDAQGNGTWQAASVGTNNYVTTAVLNGSDLELTRFGLPTLVVDLSPLLDNTTDTVDAAADPNVSTDIIFYSASSPGGFIYLDSSLNVAGKKVVLIRVADTNTATLVGGGGAQLNGSGTKALPTALYSTTTCISDGTNFYCTNGAIL